MSGARLPHVGKTKSLPPSTLLRIAKILKRIVERDFPETAKSKGKGMSGQTGAAKKLGIVQGQLSDIINRKGKGIGIVNLIAIADYEGLSLDELIGRKTPIARRDDTRGRGVFRDIPPLTSPTNVDIESAWEMAVKFARANGYEEQDIEAARGAFTIYGSQVNVRSEEFFDEIRKAFTRRIRHDSEDRALAEHDTREALELTEPRVEAKSHPKLLPKGKTKKLLDS